jgi:hypothetical protein
MNKDIIKSMDWIMEYAHNNNEKFATLKMHQTYMLDNSDDIKSKKALEILQHFDYLRCLNCDGAFPQIGYTYKATVKGYTYESWEKEQRKLSKPLDTAIRSNYIAGIAIGVLVVFEIIKLIIENNLCKCL